MKSLLPLLISTLAASLALAEPPPAATELQSAVAELVNEQLLTPLKKLESKRSRFSRAAPVAVQRRVRVLDADALTDSRGKAFVRFAVDERRSLGEHGVWKQDSALGCAYLGEREVFVQYGHTYRAARSALGKDAQGRRDVCRVVSARGWVGAEHPAAPG